MWFQNRLDTIQTVQAQKMSRGRNFWIKKVQELYDTCSKGYSVIVTFRYLDKFFQDIKEPYRLAVLRLFLDGYSTAIFRDKDNFI